MNVGGEAAMEKQEAKSNWDDLARQLGADVPPEAEPPERPPASSTSD